MPERSHPWRHLHLTIKGSSKSEHASCQDRVGSWSSSDDTTVLLAVADGAGSRELGGEGAELLLSLTDEVARGLLRKAAGAEPLDLLPLLDQQFRVIVNRWRTEIARIDAERFDDYASTFGLTLITRDGLAIVTVGDAFVCIHRDDRHDSYRVAMPPRLDESSGPGTHFVTSSSWAKRVNAGAFPDQRIDAVLLSTDGLEPAVVQYSIAPAEPDSNKVGRAVGVFLAPDIWQLVERGASAADLQAALMTPAIMAKKGDDIGLALATRRRAPRQ